MSRKRCTAGIARVRRSSTRRPPRTRGRWRRRSRRRRSGRPRRRAPGLRRRRQSSSRLATGCGSKRRRRRHSGPISAASPPGRRRGARSAPSAASPPSVSSPRCGDGARRRSSLRSPIASERRSRSARGWRRGRGRRRRESPPSGARVRRWRNCWRRSDTEQSCCASGCATPRRTSAQPSRGRRASRRRDLRPPGRSRWCGAPPRAPCSRCAPRSATPRGATPLRDGNRRRRPPPPSGSATRARSRWRCGAPRRRSWRSPRNVRGARRPNKRSRPWHSCRPSSRRRAARPCARRPSRPCARREERVLCRR